jgi:hypothetical protein
MRFHKKTLTEVLARLEYLQDCYIGKKPEGFDEGIDNVRWQVLSMLEDIELQRRSRFWR